MSGRVSGLSGEAERFVGGYWDTDVRLTSDGQDARSDLVTRGVRDEVREFLIGAIRDDAVTPDDWRRLFNVQTWTPDQVRDDAHEFWSWLFDGEALPPRTKSRSFELQLRPVMPADLDVLFEFGRDAISVFQAAFTSKDPSDRAAFDAHWKKLLAMPSVRARTVVADGVVVGSVIAFDADLGREVTYWIGRAHWGRGVASAALAALLVAEKTRPLFARASKDNVGSIRVLEKNGFRVVGANRFFANARGAEIDEVVLRLDA
jgi:RimJ/RimL family protein N-acetyltransferase